MAITSVEYTLIAKLREDGQIPPKPSVLELGESNWYGDVDVNILAADLHKHVKDPGMQMQLMAQLQAYCSQKPPIWLFGIAKVFHQVFFDHSSLEAIDMGGPSAMRYDLNQPVPLDKKYDVVVNIGTAEHVFNTCQFFDTVHRLTAPGGLMLHDLPFRGWEDHGFYAFQPTFYYDIAAANDYEIVFVAYCEMGKTGQWGTHRIQYCKTRDDIATLVRGGTIGPNSTIFAALRKPKTDAPFKIPMQGYYDGKLSEQGNMAWKTMR